MVDLPGGKSVTWLAVSIQYRPVTDRQISCDSIDRAMHRPTLRAAKIGYVKARL